MSEKFTREAISEFYSRYRDWRNGKTITVTGEWINPPTPFSTALQMVSQLVVRGDQLFNALRELMALHEPEGRFQPSHYKPVLARARAALEGVDCAADYRINQELVADLDRKDELLQEAEAEIRRLHQIHRDRFEDKVGEPSLALADRLGKELKR